MFKYVVPIGIISLSLLSDSYGMDPKDSPKEENRSRAPSISSSPLSPKGPQSVTAKWQELHATPVDEETEKKSQKVMGETGAALRTLKGNLEVFKQQLQKQASPRLQRSLSGLKGKAEKTWKDFKESLIEEDSSPLKISEGPTNIADSAEPEEFSSTLLKEFNIVGDMLKDVEKFMRKSRVKSEDLLKQYEQLRSWFFKLITTYQKHLTDRSGNVIDINPSSLSSSQKGSLSSSPNLTSPSVNEPTSENTKPSEKSKRRLVSEQIRQWEERALKEKKEMGVKDTLPSSSPSSQRAPNRPPRTPETMNIADSSTGTASLRKRANTGVPLPTSQRERSSTLRLTQLAKEIPLPPLEMKAPVDFVQRGTLCPEGLNSVEYNLRPKGNLEDFQALALLKKSMERSGNMISNQESGLLDSLKKKAREEEKSSKNEK